MHKTSYGDFNSIIGGFTFKSIDIGNSAYILFSAYPSIFFFKIG